MNIFKRLFGRNATDADVEPIRFRVALDVALVPVKGKKRMSKTIEIKGIEIPEAPTTCEPVACEPVAIDLPAPKRKSKTKHAKIQHTAVPDRETIKIRENMGAMMEITNPIAFARDLATLKTIVPNRTPKPILKSIVLESFRDTSVKAYATDLEYAIALDPHGIRGTSPGKVCVNLDSLITACKASKGSLVVLEESADGLHVSQDHSTTVLPLEDASMFPDAPSYPSQWEVTLELVALQQMLARTQHATNSSNTRFALSGLCIELLKHDESNMRFNVVATDGKRLERETVLMPTIDGIKSLPPAVLIPLKTVKLLERFKERKPVAFTIKDGNIFFPDCRTHCDLLALH
jgi:hypothetical protein